MAIDTTVTLKRQIVEFNEWATAHPMVNKFGYGQYLEVYKTSGQKYLALIVNSPTATSEDFFVNYSWEVICLDYVLDQKDNVQRVLSDTMGVLRDLENTIRYSKRWKEFSRADGNWSYREVNEFGADKCFGWIATFTLKIKKKHGICDILSLMPSYDFETGSVVYPACDPVTFAINGTSEDSFASGAEFDLTLVDTDGNTPAYTYDDTLKKLTIPASASASIDIAVNGTPFYSGVSTNQDLPVKNTNADPIGSKIGSDWIIGDLPMDFNASAITPAPAGTDKVISVVDSASNYVGTITNDTAGVLDVTIANTTVSNSDDTYTASVWAEGSLELPDETFTFQIDGVTVATETEPALSTQTFNINWN